MAKRPLGSTYANDGHRQPGSSFKPLAVYSPAIEFNLLNPCSVLDDYPYQLMSGKAWPLNSGSSRYQGRLTMREALKQSLNTVAVRIMSDYVTPEESFHFIQDRYNIDLEEGRMINGELKTDITVSLAMGGLTDGVNVRDMAEAYATFPNGGGEAAQGHFLSLLLPRPGGGGVGGGGGHGTRVFYTSPRPRDREEFRMSSFAFKEKY